MRQRALLFFAPLILIIPSLSFSELLPATDKDIEAFEEMIIHNLTLAEKPAKKAGPEGKLAAAVEKGGKKKEVWAAAPGVRLLKKSPNEKELQISHAERRQWKAKDQACIMKSNEEVVCGEIVAVTPQSAKVAVDSVISTQALLRDGEKFDPVEVGVGAAWRRNPGRRSSGLKLGLLMGVTNLSYSQTDVTGVGQTSVAAQATLSYYLGKRWVLVAEGMGTVAPLSMSGTSVATRQLELGVGTKYTARVTNQFSLIPQLSYQYETMLTPDRVYGFRNIEGPRLAVAADYLVDPSNAVRVAARATLYGSDTTRLALSNKKLGLAMSYFWDYRKSADRLGIHVEYNTLNVEFSSGAVSANTIGSYLSYSF